MRKFILVVSSTALLAACGQGEGDRLGPAEAEVSAPAASDLAAGGLEGFVHAPGEDLFGYYFPTRPVQIGDYRLDHIHIGGAMEFATWERGERTEAYAPVMLEFSDVTSPLSTNELGQEFHQRSVRLLPTAYRLGGGDFRFVGHHPAIGHVQIDGMIDLTQLAAERDGDGRPEGEAAAVLTTAAQIGPEAFRNLSFFWFGGD